MDGQPEPRIAIRVHRDMHEQCCLAGTLLTQIRASRTDTLVPDWTATIVTVAVTSAAVLLLALITVACIRLCRARTPSQPASDRFLNRFYVNNLLRDECNAEIRERERRDAEICERERPDAEPEYDYVYNHTQRTR